MLPGYYRVRNMTEEPWIGRNAGVIAALAVAIVLAGVGYAVYQKHSARTTILGMVNDAGVRLRAVLRARPDEALDYAAHVKALEAQSAALRALNRSRVIELADAADGFLVVAREILRRRAAMHSAGEQLTASSRALAAHIQTDRGGAHWTRDAVQLQQAAERDFRDYRIAAESYVALLDSLPDAQSQLAPHVDAAALTDAGTIDEARKIALDALARTDENMKQTTLLEAYRGTRAAPPL